jgi:hypothetical protein
MSRTSKSGVLKIILLMSILGFWFNTRISFGIPDSDIFELQVVGYSNGGLFAGPCPPNTTCTYDAPGWRDMTLGLTYLGESSFTVTNIQVIQTLNFMGSYWNVSNSNQIISQNISLSKGNTFFFLAKGTYTFFDQGSAFSFPLYVKITDMNDNIYWVYLDSPKTLIELTDNQYLSNLPFISRSGLSPMISFLFLVTILLVYGLKRKGDH